jgi:hypothetical protein
MSEIYNYNELRNRIFSCNDDDFNQLAIEIFQFQYHFNTVYRSYCDALGINPAEIKKISTIPFLPIQFYKTKEIVSTSFIHETIFESSGTTGSIKSRHVIKDVKIYAESFLKNFELFYGAPENYCIIGLLPSYLERENSSLVYMVNRLIENSRHHKSGFYLNDFNKLQETLLENEYHQQQTLLIGVSFALLDFAEQYPMQLKHTIVMETGGMKGRKKEMIRSAFHEILQSKLGMENIHSEYGMTELLSQAYSKKDGLFSSPPWMKVLIRAEDDPFDVNYINEKKILSGAVNIIDLANLYSCSFIATDDCGKLHPNGSFEITGRLDNSDIRGCSLMAI